MKFGRMDGEAVRMIVSVLLVLIVASRATGEYDGRGSDAVEGPRVERMHSETSDACIGGNCLTQNSEGPVGAMWFGPRLGRRRRSDSKLTNKKIEVLGEILGSPAWNNMIASPGGGDDKRQETTFTPRLGRELEDAISLYDLVHGLLNRVEEHSDNERDQQSPPPMFPPRLGRTLASPRLEHELRNLLRKLQMPI